MKPLRLVIFLVVALAQLALPASTVWRRSQTLKYGRVWKFQTAPVDPVDAMRGRYISLKFSAEDFPRKERFEGATQAYATLKEGADGYAVVEDLSAKPVSGDNVLKVGVRGYWNDVQHVAFPFDRYWVSERLAPAVENAYVANSRRGKMNAYVTVRVRHGDAAVADIYFDNLPFREYLRSQAKP